MYTRLVALILVVLCLGLTSGCGQKTGDSPQVSKNQALSAVKKQTPLKTVQKAEVTPPGPPMWVVYGTDESGRPLAAWAWKPGTVEGYTYLDKGISATDAVARAKAAGFTPMIGEAAVLVRPSSPVWYVFIHKDNGNQGVVLIDLTTREVTK